MYHHPIVRHLVHYIKYDHDAYRYWILFIFENSNSYIYIRRKKRRPPLHKSKNVWLLSVRSDWLASDFSELASQSKGVSQRQTFLSLC